MNGQRSDSKREQIAAAFILLLEDTPLENLRIQELCARAGVSKATFYRLFPDKYEVGNWIYKIRANRIISEHPYLRCWSDWTMLIFSEMLEHRRFFRNIASYRGQNSFLEFLASYYYANVLSFRNASTPEPTGDQLFAIRMFSLVGAQVALDWIMQGYQPEPEEVQRRAELCLPDCIRAYFQ